MKLKFRFFALLIFLALFQSACDDKSQTPQPEDSFDRAAMLSNIADNVIVPSYLNIKTSTEDLALAADVFTNNPDLASLIVLQEKYMEAYKSFQFCSTFEFGPAENYLIRASFNTFPCDTVKIKSNINSGVHDLDAAANIAAKGFPALDFLLFRKNMDNNYVLTCFSDSMACNYLSALVTELKLKSDLIYNSWSFDDGNFAASFKNSTGTDAGSSVSVLVNQLNYDLEILKNFRIGIPLGKKTLGQPLPAQVEAYYSQNSLELVRNHLISLENTYRGRSLTGVDGSGLDDYLSFVNAQHSAGALNDVIISRFNSAKTKLDLINGPLSYDVVNNPSLVDAAYAELQQLVILLKVDMPSALGVLITYQDNDGD